MAVTYDKANQTAGLNSDTRLNAELTKIQTALQDAVSRSGTSPNAMSANLDMGGNQIINALSVDTDNLTVNGSSVPGLSDIQALYAATQASAASAAADEGSAAASAAAAAASAAGVNLPSLGTAGQILQVNSGATALENHTPTSAATASSVARRDASGRLQVATPSADADVATKGYADGLLVSSTEPTGWTRTKVTYLLDDAPASTLTQAVATEGVWTTIGPTGSGADYVWSALDTIPTDAVALQIKVGMESSDTTGNATFTTTVSLGKDSSNYHSISHKLYHNGTDSVRTEGTEAVLLSTGRIFAFRWTCGADTPAISLGIVGYAI